VRLLDRFPHHQGKAGRVSVDELERPLDPEAGEVLESHRGLYAKLAEVVGAVGRIEKSGFNDFHKYAYVKEDDLTEAIRGELASRGVVLLSSVLDSERVATLTTVTVRFTFVDSVTGEQHAADWQGTGEDKGDKGLYKAYTGALKYFLLKNFLVPTGNDPDAGKEPSGRKAASGVADDDKPITKKQAEQLNTARDVVGVTDSDWQLKLNTYGASVDTDLTRGQGRELHEWLKGQVA
jgi:hypothetical protein